MPTVVKALTMTTSRYGITYKDLVCKSYFNLDFGLVQVASDSQLVRPADINDKDQVAFIPRRLLDPRRPDVPSSRDKEEMLIPYDPLLSIDPRRTLSHAYDVSSLTP